MVEDLEAFLADFGEECKVGTMTFRCLVDQPDAEVQVGRSSITTAKPELTVSTDVVRQAGIRYGVPITVGGKRYTVRNVARIEDGAFSSVGLTSEVPP